MSYYGDGISYYYGGGPFANHSSLMTGTGRHHTPLRYTPHLSTISESPLGTYRRYSPVILPCRPRRIIDTADIDVSTPRLLSSNHSHQGGRLHRDRPTIRIRSQALKDNPTLRDHVERREKTVGELLVEKFLIKDKKLSPDDVKMKMYKQMNSKPNISTDEPQKINQKRVSRRMTRRRSSADVAIDPEQLERQIVIAQVQAEVLDNLVAEEQAEIEVETRKGTFIQKKGVRGTILQKSTCSESDEEENITEGKRKIQKKIKRRKKTADKPSPPCDSVPVSTSNEIKGKIFKVEACNSVGELSTFLLNSTEQKKRLEQFRESIRLPPPKSFNKTTEVEEEIVILPTKKSYVCDNSRNSVYLTLKMQVGKSIDDNVELEHDTKDIEAYRSTTNDDESLKAAKNQSKDIFGSDVEVKVAVDISNSRGIDETEDSRGKDEVVQKGLIKLPHASSEKEDLTIVSSLSSFSNCSEDVAQTNQNFAKSIEEQSNICGRIFSDDIAELSVREESQIDGFKSKTLVKDGETISLTQNSTWDFHEGEKKADRKKKRKKKALFENEEGLTHVNLVINSDNEIRNEEYKSKSESLPNTKLKINHESKIEVDLTTNIESNKSNTSSIGESTLHVDCEKITNDNKILQEIPVNVDKSIEEENLLVVIENNRHINEPVAIINDNSKTLINLTKNGINLNEQNKIFQSNDDDNNIDVSKTRDTENSMLPSDKSKDSPLENIAEVKLKNKNLIKLKTSSTDSGIGSLDIESVKIGGNQVKKKILKNSKGSSFECDDEVKFKPTIEQKLKTKLINSKSLPIATETETVPKSRVNNTEKNKSESTIDNLITTDKKKVTKGLSLPILNGESKQKEETTDVIIVKDSGGDIDFWSEIKSVEPLPSKIVKSKQELQRTISNDTSINSLPKILPTNDVVEPDTPTKKLSATPVKKKKKTECNGSSVKVEKKEDTAGIIFDEATLEKCEPDTDVKSLRNSHNNNIQKSNEIVLEKSDSIRIHDSQEYKTIMDENSETIRKSSNKSEKNENNEITSTESSVLIINVSEIPEKETVMSAEQDKDEDEEEKEDAEDDGDEPKTPTNEANEADVSGNMSKWNGSPNLTALNDKEVASSTVETVNEAAGSTAASPQTSGKKKLGRRKKSSAKSLESTIICKISEERSSNSSDTTLKPSAFHLAPKPNPKDLPKKNRPVDLTKMFYTTPTLLLTATPRDLSKVKRAKIKRRKHSTRTPSASSDSTGSTTSTQSTGTAESTRSNSTEVDDEAEQKRISSTRSNDSGFDGSPRLSNCDMACHKKCEKLTGNLCGLNQKLVAEALQELKRAPSQSSDNQRHSDSSDHVHGGGRITPPATNLPRFKKYVVEDFNFLKVLGKGSFGKVLLAELRGTECVYAVKCLKKDVVLEDDDVECTLIERKVLTLATRHPYLCHLFCTFQTESHLFFVMEYLNGGDLMFHIQKSGRFAEFRAKFYAAEIWSGLNFLHKKGIVYRDLKLDNVLLDFEGHIRIADFGMCKLQIFLDRTADTFCGTPDYMAPEIIKGQKYNQSVDWWSFGVLLYEMLTGLSPFSGCDEDELFWSICNERPFIPRYLSQESVNILVTLLEKDAGKRPLGHEIQAHSFFHNIHWDRLERRLLQPPFKPTLDHTLDTKYFDTAFTVERPHLTPVPEQILSSMDQGVFRGFSYTNPNATD